MSYACNACMDTKTISYPTDPSDLTTWDNVAETPCPLCQATTTLDLSVSALEYLASEYFNEAIEDPAEASRLAELFRVSQTYCNVLIRIPATEEMVERFHEFIDGSQP